MAPVAFSLQIEIDGTPQGVWEILVDWKRHEAIVPMTRVDIEHVEPSGVGTIFTAYTGRGPLTLEDRMEVTELSWDDEAQTGRCRVEKLGPVMSGFAEFTVSAKGSGAVIDWLEDVEVAKLPAILGPLVGHGAALGFRVVGVGVRRELAKTR